MRLHLLGIFLFIIVLLSGTELMALASPNVPVGDVTYDYLDKLIAYGLVPNAIYGQRPWSRNEVARMVTLATKKQESFCPPNREQTHAAPCALINEILDTLQDEFREELIDRHEGEGERKTLRFHLLDRLQVDYTGLSSPWRQVPVNNGVGSIEAQANPLVGYRDGEHLVHGHRMALLTRNFVKLGPYVSLDAEPHLELLLPDDGELDANALVGRAYASAVVRNVRLLVGRDSLIWGQGENGGVLASRNVRPMDMIVLSNDEPFRLPWVFRHMGDHKYSLLVANLGPDYTLKNAFVYGMAASLKPLPILELGFKHQITTGGEGAPNTEFLDLVSEFFFYRQQGRYLGSGSNVGDHRFGFDLRLAIPFLRNTVLYGEGIFEDFGKESFFPQFTQQMGFQTGLDVPLLTADGRNEFSIYYTHIPPAYGRHGTWPSGLSLNALSRGDPLGPQSQTLTAEMRHWVSLVHRLEGQVSYMNSGNDLFSVLPSSTGGPDEVVKTTDLTAEHRFLLSTALVWELRRGIVLCPQIGYERVYNFNFTARNDRQHMMGALWVEFSPSAFASGKK